jgi:hypothetical protein
MKIGFTGTQRGMTEEQVNSVAFFIAELNPTEVHHGDCIGADADFHKLVRATCPQAKIVIHPPLNESKRAFCEGDEILPAKDYLVRNHDIVEASEVMIATPEQVTEQKRGSGTWATIRYSRKLHPKVYLITVYPNGFSE